jgi:CMP-N-acetylneuraminic acid synthetase
MEFFVEDMKNLPKVVEKRLKELRQMDSASNKSLLTLNDEGNKIFEELAELSKANPEFDEAPIREKFQALLGKRGSTLTALDEQMKKITKLYDLVDGRIAFLGE